MTAVAHALAGALKNQALPAGPVLRRLPCGIGAGTRMEVDFHHHTKLYLGLYEIEINRYIRELCASSVSCFDVGGQTGYDALVLARLTPGRVVSIDCDPTAAARMRRVFASNPRLRDRLSVIETTVGRCTDAAGGVRSLDEIAYSPESFVPDFVKLDIDGGEADALTGSERLLRDHRPHLIVETHSPELEAACAETLRAAGYAPSIVNQRSWLKDLRPPAHNRWLIARGTPGR
jgi:methyltransferase FkbM-like protein